MGERCSLRNAKALQGFEVGLRGDSLRIEAKDQIEAIRLAEDAVLEDGLLIFVQRIDKGDLLKMNPVKGPLLYGDQEDRSP